MGVFEDFVNANLPLRVVEYNPLNSSYDGDPNDVGAPTQIQNAVAGAFYYNSSGELYVKETSSPATWVPVGSGAGGGAGEVSASYLVLNATSSLANERVFAFGPGMSASDGGPGNPYTLYLTSSLLSASYVLLTGSSLFPNHQVLTAGSGTYFQTASNSLTVHAPVNFSYKTIVTNSTLVIPQYQQMLYDGVLVVDGDIVLDGDIVENNDAKTAFHLVVSGGNLVELTSSNIPTADQVLTAISPTQAVFKDTLTTFKLTGSTLYTTSSVTILDNKPTSHFGSDVKFYVSGTVSSGSASDSVSVFGGTVKISGTLSVGSASLIIDDNSIRAKQGQITLFDSSFPAGKSLQQMFDGDLPTVSSSIATDINSITSSVTNLSSSVATDINNLSSQVGSTTSFLSLRKNSGTTTQTVTTFPLITKILIDYNYISGTNYSVISSSLLSHGVTCSMPGVYRTDFNMSFNTTETTDRTFNFAILANDTWIPPPPYNEVAISTSDTVTSSLYITETYYMNSGDTISIYVMNKSGQAASELQYWNVGMTVTKI